MKRIVESALRIPGGGQHESNWTHWEILIGCILICLGIARFGSQRDEIKTSDKRRLYANDEGMCRGLASGFVSCFFSAGPRPVWPAVSVAAGFAAASVWNNEAGSTQERSGAAQ